MTAAEELSPLKRALVEIRDLKARVARAEARRAEPIALVGIGLRFPGGATDTDSFWELLWNGVDAVTEVPAERWAIDDLYDPDPDAPGKMTTRHGGFLADVDRFDAAFFGISPREAERMDPQQRLLLEVTWEALEHAGIAADGLFGTNAGVFLGICNSDYLRMLLADPESIDAYTTSGNATSIAAGRLSYVLGAQGPAMSVDTACSSSLVAVHLAMQALRNGESDLALAGGVNLILAPEVSINFSRARMLAADGRCKTFDADADGYVRAEGCAMVVLKRLSDAEADGDRILAVIRGSAVTQDGRSGGITAPNGPSQEKVITTALASAGVGPHDIGYVEAHGTGTPLGDPIEVGALGAALTVGRPADSPLLLGSVKTNVGHMEAAAGVGGLIKVALMLQHGAIPPHLHLGALNPHIAAARLPIAVPTEATPWPPGAAGRIAGVSSFGLSGTNAHLVVTAAPAPAAAVAATDGRPRVLTLSARSEGALRELAGRHAAHLAAHPERALADVAYNANTGRARLDHRLAVVVRDAAAAVDALAAYAGDAPDTGVLTAVAGSAPVVAFLFTGHGSHYAGMGRQLYAEHEAFRSALDRCAELLRGELDVALTDVLFGAGGHLDQMVYAQPALFALQYALAAQWRAWGVEPAVVAGHSAGEYAAAVVAGVLDLEAGLRLITARGRLMQTLTGAGKMAALFVDEATAARAVAAHGDRVGIAAVNGPTTTVVSGAADAVRAVIADLGLDDADHRILDVSVPAHSPLVEPILDDFEATVRTIALQPPQIGLVSSMTGAFVGEEITGPRYWRDHLRRPVRFAAAVDALRGAGATAFVEIGPQPTLVALGQRCWPDDSATWTASLRRDADEPMQLATALATLHIAGVPVDWRAHEGAPRRRLALATYPWQRERYWAVAPTRRPAATPVWPAAVAAAAAQAEQAPLDLRIETYPERWAVLDRLAIAFIVRAWRGLDVFTTAGATTTVAALVDRGIVAAGHALLAERWLGHLADEGMLDRDGDAFVAARPLAEPDVDGLLARAEAAFGADDPLLAYVRRCGDHLAAVVAGEESALSTLFPDGSYETVDHLYHAGAVARYGNGMVRAAVTAVAAADPGRPLRVVELGAGTGGTSASVLSTLAAASTSYVFTDVSDFFLARAAERFAAYPFVSYAKLDIERPPQEQGLAAASYDVVIAANVLHATRDLDVTLAHVRSLLAPGGVLVAYESTLHPRWFDITTGLIEGWQRFDDGWREGHPLLKPEQWSAALAAAGFTAVVALPGPDLPTTILGQHVVLAQAPGERSARPDVVEADAAAPAVRAARAARPAIDPGLATALGDERHELLVVYVRQAVAYVLRLADPDRLRRDQPLLDAGFDSLMAVELRNVLRDGAGLTRKLPSTLVFDHPNIAAIATYLERLMVADGRLDPPICDEPPVTASATATRAAGPDLDAVMNMSDDEVEALLLKKLSEISPS